MRSAVLEVHQPSGPDPAPRAPRVGLLGCGAVGSEVVRRLSAAAPCGIAAHLGHIAVADPSKPRGPWVDHDLIHAHPADVVTDPGIDVVIELIGGIEPARTLILEGLHRGKDVVTANKQVLAHHGAELFEAARVTGSLLHFEASVGGAVPVVRTISQAMAGDTITSVSRVLSGTRKRFR